MSINIFYPRKSQTSNITAKLKMNQLGALSHSAVVGINEALNVDVERTYHCL